MSTPAARRALRRRRLVRRGWLGVVTAAVLLASISGVGYAFWAQSGSLAGGSLTAGDMAVTVGELSWRQVTPGVTAPASGQLTGTPTGFYAQPGDVLEISAPVTTFLKGDNLAGALSVAYADPGSADPGTTVTFHVEDLSGQQVAPDTGEAPIGSVVVAPGLIGDDQGVTDQWLVVLTVTVGGDVTWVTDPPPTSGFATWSIGTIEFDLDQVRRGVGFIGPSATPAGGAGS